MNGVTFGESVSVRDVAERAGVRAFDLWWAAFGAALIPVSLVWDFSWESTIGVDRFWSPPHLATHIGVWLCGLLGARLVLTFTRAWHRSGAAAGVGIGGLCGPSGAWILLWGAAAVQVALPLENWWQQAYGLGAGLWPPSQILKAVGFFTILFGGVVLCAGARSNDLITKPALSALLAWQGGLVLTMCALVLTVKNYPNWQHTAGFYKGSCAIYPVVLLAMARGSSARWSATKTALVYVAIMCAMIWLLPLFPARPLTAPIHNPTDHMMPPTFPLLLVVPALVIDLLRWRFCLQQDAGANQQAGATKWKRMKRGELWIAIAAGVGFVATFVPVQWFFSEFLLSSSSDNWFFAGGGRHWPFFLKIDQARSMFWDVKRDPLTCQTALLAMVFAVISAWIGLWVGSWLAKVRR